jgi:hypothetical protein
MAKKNKICKEEIRYHIVNSVLAGALVFLGSVVGAGGEITLQGTLGALTAGLIVCVTKFKDFWGEQATKKPDVTKQLFSFY